MLKRHWTRREWLHLAGAISVTGIAGPGVASRVAQALTSDDTTGLSLRIMSFNIRTGSAADGDNSWEYRKEQLGDCVVSQSPDLLGLQESQPFQSEWLTHFLSRQHDSGRSPEYASFGRTREVDPTQGEAMTIFYRKDRFERIAEDTGTFWLSETPEEPGSASWDTACRRIVTWSRFRSLERPNCEFYYYNTHLDHISKEARRKGAILIIDRILGRQVPSVPAFLTGDFNCGESSDPIQAIREGGLVDTFRVVHPDATDVGTFHGFSGKAGKDKIDYIFTTPDVHVTSAEILRTHRDGRYPSDHFPLTADIRIGTE